MGADQLFGENGFDVLDPGPGNDSVDGGPGFDTVDYFFATASVTIDLNAGTASGADIGTDTLISIEDATGGGGADTIIGTAADNFLFS